ATDRPVRDRGEPRGGRRVPRRGRGEGRGDQGPDPEGDPDPCGGPDSLDGRQGDGGEAAPPGDPGRGDPAVSRANRFPPLDLVIREHEGHRGVHLLKYATVVPGRPPWRAPRVLIKCEPDQA